jgi:hypothetical protein
MKKSVDEGVKGAVEDTESCRKTGRDSGGSTN